MLMVRFVTLSNVSLWDTSDSLVSYA